jgi:hypothetical protein
MLVALRNPPTAPQAHNSDDEHQPAHATEFSRFTTFFLSSTFPPNGYNWGNFANKNTTNDRQDRSRPIGRHRRQYQEVADCSSARRSGCTLYTTATRAR